MNMPRTRFFEPGGTLSHNSPCYVKRQADDTLISALAAHEYCYILDSRQKGKSSLMVRTAKVLKEDGMQTVLLDLQGRGSNLSLEQWYAGMLTRFGEELNARNDLLKYWQTHLHLGPLERFFAAIEEVVLPNIVNGLVVFVDEVDFVRSLPFRTDEFFGGIRHFYNRRATDRRFELLSFVLIGTADPLELISDPNLTPFNIGRRIELQDFKLQECGPLAKGLSDDPMVASSLMERIIYWTSGHPYLTQRLCEMVAENGAIKSAEVDRIVAQIFLSDEAQTNEPNLHDVRRRVAEGIPVGIEPTEYFRRVREIYGRLLRGKTVLNSQQDPVIASLKLSGLIGIREGQLCIRTRIYKHVFDTEWLGQLGATDEDEEQAQRRLTSTAASRARQKVINNILLAGAVVLTTLFCTYRYMWSYDQPRFFLEKNTIFPGETISMKGQFLNGAQARLSDEVGRESTMPVTPNSDGGGYGYTIHVPKSQPPGSYTLQVSRAPFLGFLSFGWSHITRGVTVGDDRPFDLSGHQNIVTTASFSPDGAHILTASGDTTARIWNVLDPSDVRELRGHKNSVLSAYYSSDGKRIVTASWDGTAIIWSVATRKKLFELKGHRGKVWRASFSPDGSKVLTCGEDGTARLWDSNTGHELMTLKGHQGRVMCENFSPDGKTLATASFDGTVRMWNASTGKQLWQLPKTQYRCFFVSFSPDGSRIVTASDQGTATVWDAVSGKQLLLLKGHKDWVVFAAYSPDGKRISTASADKTARVWDAKNGRLLVELIGHKDRVNTAYFSPDGTRIVTACLNERIARVWDAKTGKPLPRPIVN